VWWSGLCGVEEHVGQKVEKEGLESEGLVWEVGEKKRRSGEEIFFFD
jgi:hypothetical protein